MTTSPDRNSPAVEAGPTDRNDLTEYTIKSERVYDGVLLKARRETVRLPDGSSGTREWLDHPGAAAVVPFFGDGSILLVRQFRFPPRKEFLEIPAGKLDVPGESPLDVAKRELEEETGYVGAEFESLGSIFPCIGYSNECIHLFIARGLSRGTQQLSEGEFVEPIRVPFSDALAMVETGEIDDAKTVSALLLADRLMQRKER